MPLGALRASLLASIPAIFAGTVQAAEWRYCLAPAHAERKIYMTHPFYSTVDYPELEEMFRASLKRAGFSVDSVQCPLGGNERSILAMREHAVAFNRKLQIIAVDLRWAP